jgi:hypothetical protein
MLTLIENDLFEGLSSWKIPIPPSFMEIIRFSEEKWLDILTTDWYKELIRKWATKNEIEFFVRMKAFSAKYYAAIEKILNNKNEPYWKKR